MSKLKRAVLFLFLAAGALPALAQVDTAWVRRYNGPGNGSDQAKAITVDSSGNVYVTGFSGGAGTGGDFTTIKYLPSGDTAWVRRHTSAGSYLDEGRSIAVDKNGNVYVTGRSDRGALTIKYNSSGDTLWTRLILSLSVSTETNALAIDDSGNVYVTGFSGTNYITAKYLPTGDTAWVRYYGTSAVAVDVAVDSARNVYVTGKSAGAGTGLDYVTIKYAPNGDTLWVRRYNVISEDAAADLALDEAGNVYVTGFSTGQGAAGRDYATIKYSPSGDSLWVSRLDLFGNLAELPRALAVDKSGNVYVCGDEFTGSTASSYDFTLVKYAPNGDTLWVRFYNGPANKDDQAYAIALDDDGNIYVTGRSNGGTYPNIDYATVKYSSSGDTLWTARYQGSKTDSLSYAYAVALDKNNNVYVTGGSTGTGTNFDFATIKYAQSAPALVIQAFSPVDLTVVDPNNDSIGVSFNTISEASYSVSNDSVHIPAPLAGIYNIKVKLDPLDSSGDTTYTLTVKMGGSASVALASNERVPGPGETQIFTITSNPANPNCFSIPGDVNASGGITIGDIIHLVNYIFDKDKLPCLGSDPGNCWNPNLSCRGDANQSGTITIGDIVHLVNFIFDKDRLPCLGSDPGNCWTPDASGTCCLPVP